MTHGMLTTPSALLHDTADRSATETTFICIVACGHHELIQDLRAVFGHSMHIIEDRRRGKALLPRDAGGKDMEWAQPSPAGLGVTSCGAAG